MNTLRELLGAFLGGSLAYLGFGLIHPVAVFPGVVVGVILGYHNVRLVRMMARNAHAAGRAAWMIARAAGTVAWAGLERMLPSLAKEFRRFARFIEDKREQRKYRPRRTYASVLRLSASLLYSLVTLSVVAALLILVMQASGMWNSMLQHASLHASGQWNSVLQRIPLLFSGQWSGGWQRVSLMLPILAFVFWLIGLTAFIAPSWRSRKESLNELLLYEVKASRWWFFTCEFGYCFKIWAVGHFIMLVLLPLFSASVLLLVVLSIPVGLAYVLAASLASFTKMQDHWPCLVTTCLTTGATLLFWHDTAVIHALRNGALSAAAVLVAKHALMPVFTQGNALKSWLGNALQSGWHVYLRGLAGVASMVFE
jgi:hypothetical protein